MSDTVHDNIAAHLPTLLADWVQTPGRRTSPADLMRMDEDMLVFVLGETYVPGMVAGSSTSSTMSTATTSASSISAPRSFLSTPTSAPLEPGSTSSPYSGLPPTERPIMPTLTQPDQQVSCVYCDGPIHQAPTLTGWTHAFVTGRRDNVWCPSGCSAAMQTNGVEDDDGDEPDPDC